jgi:hypothetical protein
MKYRAFCIYCPASKPLALNIFTSTSKYHKKSSQGFQRAKNPQHLWFSTKKDSNPEHHYRQRTNTSIDNRISFL